MRTFSTGAAFVLFMALVALWGARTQSVLSIPDELDRQDRWGMEDYRDAGYYPVRAMFSGVNPYHTTRFLESYPVRQVFPLYSPAMLLVNSPFALFSLGTAQRLYFLVSVLLIPVFALLLLRSAGVEAGPARVLWMSAFVTAGRPMYSNLTLGQSAIFIAIGVLMALHYGREKPILGGIGLAIATLKPTFGIPLALLLLVRRDYRTVLTGIGIGATAALIPVAVLTATAGGVAGWFEAIPDNLRHFSSHPANALDTASWGRIDASVVLVRLLGISQFPGFGLTVAIGGLGAAALAIRRLAHTGVSGWSSSLANAIICFAVLVSVFHQSYDALILALPLTLAAAGSHGSWGATPRAMRLVLIALLGGLWFNYLTTNVGLGVAGLEPWSAGWRLATSLNSLALLISFSVCLVMVRRADLFQPQLDSGSAHASS